MLVFMMRDSRARRYALTAGQQHSKQRGCLMHLTPLLSMQVEALRDGVKGELVDPRGNALPPCIVMERGESLQEWCNRAEPDLFASLAVRPCISSV
jgi:hypothetical protein